jgi:peroxiredoxin
MELSKAYGLAFKVDADTVALYKNNYNIDIEADSGETHHLLPVPAVVIIGSDNLIKYIYWNADYKIRLAPQALLQAAKDIH